MNALSRREAIKKVALLMGGTLALPDILKAWAEPTVENTAYLFTPGQAEVLAEICELIIPTTDTPGAKAAGVPAFIQKFVADCYEDADRKAFSDGFAMVETLSRDMAGADFMKAGAAKQVEILKAIEKKHHDDKKANPWWGTMKQLTMFGYFTSEIGCTQALRYEPVPGRYDGAYPYKKGDRAWA